MISYTNERVKPPKIAKRNINNWINSVASNYDKTIGEIAYIFCDDSKILEINKTYLQHDYYTDIITFDLSERPESITGEIYISTDRVRDNSITLGVTIKEELHRVIFHGALHLCGYKDKTPKDAKLMREAAAVKRLW